MSFNYSESSSLVKQQTFYGMSIPSFNNSLDPNLNSVNYNEGNTKLRHRIISINEELIFHPNKYLFYWVNHSLIYFWPLPLSGKVLYNKKNLQIRHIQGNFSACRIKLFFTLSFLLI